MAWQGMGGSAAIPPAHITAGRAEAMSSTLARTTAGDDHAAALPLAATEHDVRRAFALMRRLARNPFVPIRPTAHQMTYLLADEREVLFTGSGGSGRRSAC
jgi:hypothetical protein